MSERLAPRGLCRTVHPGSRTRRYRLFISYRQQDSLFQCKLLSSALKAKFGADNVFLDTEKIEMGDVFPDRIRRAAEQADVVLLVMGEQFLDAPHFDGGRRIDYSDDWVRQEIEIARTRARLIPVLLGGTEMPRRNDFPEEVRWITDRQAVHLRNESWDQDVDHLVARLEKPNPGVRFLHRGERQRLGAPTGALIKNAVTKPCTIGVAAIIAGAAIIGRIPVLFALAALTYMLLATITFSTLSEVEWVASRTERLQPGDEGSGTRRT
jgi:hypothetical protein